MPNITIAGGITNTDRIAIIGIRTDIRIAISSIVLLLSFASSLSHTSFLFLVSVYHFRSQSPYCKMGIPWLTPRAL